MENQDLQNQKPFKDHFLNSLFYFFYIFFFYFLILLPLDLWKKATIRLSGQKDSKNLSISQITGLWPFISFLKRFFLEFLIDGAIFISYVLGPIMIIAWFIYTLSCEYCGEFDYLQLLIRIAAVYFSPILLSIIRDLFQLSILPFRKFINWVSKPAQFMDLEIKNKN
jgi:hypothetical protein